MPSEAFAGRIGGLVVALGIGAAFMTGWNSALALADESGGTPGSSASSTTSDTDTATTDRSSAHTNHNSRRPGPTTNTSTGTNDDVVRSAPLGVAVGTGGLTKDGSAWTTTAAQPRETAEPSKQIAADEPTSKSTTRKNSNRTEARATTKLASTPLSMAPETTPDATMPAATTARDTTDIRGADLDADSAQPSHAAALRTASMPSPVAVDRAALSPKIATPNVVSVVSRLVNVVVDAVLSPFAASTSPATPAHTPAVWALLAFVRREFDKAFTSPSTTEKPVDAQTTSETSEQRTLILSAFPAETDAILARTTLDPNPTVVVDGHHFYLGTLGGKKVIIAMTGIGMLNATQTTEVALDHFTPESPISVNAVVFDGVAGGSGRTEIGSVAVPARWTSDGGKTWHAVDPGMLAAANALDVNLLSTDSIGDPACSCGLFAGPQIDLKREPQLFVGGDGSSEDNNNGTAFPAIPLGGAIFGPQPCAAPDRSLLFTGNFFQAIGPFLAFGLISNITGLLTNSPQAVDATDMETAAAQQVADAHGIPFLGVRGMSDGPGDPLNLPGYPFTFVVYKQIAADNAAIVTEAFLENWAGG